MAVTINGTTGIVTPDIGVDGSTLVIDSANNRVGVLEDSPSNTLTVGDTVQPSYAPTRAGNYIEIARTSGADAGLLINKDTGQWLVGINNGDGANAPLRFEYAAAGSSHPGLGAGTLGMIINHSGQVGIGTDTPDAKLHLYSGTSNPTRVVIQGDGSSTAAASLILHSSDESSNWRATGTFYYDAQSDVEWFSGRPYSASDAFSIHRKSSIVGSTGNSTANLANSLFLINSSGKVTITSATNSGDAPNGGDNLVIKDSDGCGISVLSGDGNSSNIYLGSQTDEDAVRLEGFYNSGSPYFTTSVAGTERLRITTDGYAILNTANARLEWTASSGSNPFIRSIGSGQQSLEFNTGGDERLRITSNGIIKTPNLQGNNHREIHRHITGFSSGSSVVNYLLICETSRENVRLAGRLFTARSSGTSACSSQLFDITFQTNHNATHRSGAIMGLHSGSESYGHAEAEFVSLTYNSTNYYAIRFKGSSGDGWVTDFDTCSFDGIREHLGTELFTHIDSINETITNVSVLNADTNKGDVTIQQADLRISDGDVIMANGHGISFSATSNATGMSSELLDDYEEGEFTITLANSVTIHTQTQARYVKIGRIVHVTGQFRINNDNSNSVLIMNNLPFVSVNTGTNDGGFSPGAIRLYQYPDPGGFGNYISMVQKNNTNLYFYYSRASNTDGQILAYSNGYVAFSCTYHTAS